MYPLTSFKIFILIFCATRSLFSGTVTCNKYSTLLHGILVHIVPKVGMFPEAEGRGKYPLPRMQYVPIFHKEGLNISLLHRISLFHNFANLFERH